MSNRTDAAFEEYIGDRILAPVLASFENQERAKRLARDAFMRGASWAAKEFREEQERKNS